MSTSGQKFSLEVGITAEPPEGQPEANMVSAYRKETDINSIKTDGGKLLAFMLL